VIIESLSYESLIAEGRGSYLDFISREGALGRGVVTLLDPRRGLEVTTARGEGGGGEFFFSKKRNALKRREWEVF